MNGSYLQHSQNSKEYIEGKNSALRAVFGKENIVNPYFSDTREWLNWQLGFESITPSNDKHFHEILPMLFDATLGYTDWDPMGFR